jgi:hypothetical protein
MQSKLDGVFKGIKTALTVAGITAAVKGIGDALEKAGAVGDTIDESSQKLGLSRKAYQEWGYVLEQNGSNIDSFGVAMKTLQNAMVQGTAASDAALDKLGLSAAKLKTLSPEDALKETIAAFQKMPEGAEKSAAAVDLFGKQGMELLPTLNMTTEATADLIQQANDLGIVLNDETIDAGAEFSDTLATMKDTVSAAGTSFLSSLLPGITQVMDKLIPFFSNVLPKLGDAFGKVLEKIEPLIESLLGGFTDAVTWIADNADTLIPILEGVAGAILLWNGYQALLNITMAANPIGAVITAVAYLAAGLLILNDAFSGGRTATNKYNSAMDDSIGAISNFKDSVNNLKPTLTDVNDLLSSNGHSVSDLNTSIDEAEAAITGILKTALQEHRDLRQSELDDIKKYNDDILALEQEKISIYRDQQIAEMQKIYLEEGQMTQDEAAQRLENIGSAFATVNEVSEQAYTAQLTQIENFHKTKGTLNSEAYLNDQQEAKATYESQLAENETYYQQSLDSLLNSSAQWVSADQDKWNSLTSAHSTYVTQISELQQQFIAGERTNAADGIAIQDDYANSYSDIMDGVMLDNANAYLQMYLAAKQGNADISQEYKDMVANILSNFTDLPTDMQDKGKQALLGLIGGMEDQIPGLEDTSNMTADQIIAAIVNALGIHSPSTVMFGYGQYISQGLINGMNDKAASLSGIAATLGKSVEYTFRSALPQSSAKGIGQNFTQGLIDGLNSKLVTLRQTASSIAYELVTTFKNAWGEHSPSTVMAASGKNLMLGLANGIAENADKVKLSMAGLLPDSLSATVMVSAEQAQQSTSSHSGLSESPASSKQTAVNLNYNVYATDTSYAEQRRIAKSTSRAIGEELNALA